MRIIAGFFEANQIHNVVSRADDLYNKYMGIGLPDLLSLSMDITATHLNGCPLDFDKLLTASDPDFAHDVFGISRHIDRTTGKLKDHFLPRCSKIKEASL